MSKDRAAFREFALSLRKEAVAFCADLARIDSCNPPGDTRGIARLCAEKLVRHGVEVEIVSGREPIANVVARVRGSRPGRRLAFNGHLDTGPVPQRDRWTVDPFGGVTRDGRLYGRGVSDMKAGVSAMCMTLAALAGHRSAFAGEAVLALVGDEGTGGVWGTRYVLDHHPEAIGDALLSADVGSTGVARFGEKGYQWIEIQARGRSAGGAHPHLGHNAADALLEAIRRIQRVCAVWPLVVPEDVRAQLLAAGARSESLSGAGETAAMMSVTANLGVLIAGERPNLVPANARALMDIRFPPGVTRAEILAKCRASLGGLDDVEIQTLEGADPNWTDPDSEIVRTLVRCASAELGESPALSLRLGFSDARLYRERSVPAVVLGATPRNGNAPDESVATNEISDLLMCHAMTAFDYLSQWFPER